MGGPGNKSGPGNIGEQGNMSSAEPERAPNCLKCRHFYVTWDPRFPRGCRVFGVKTRGLPSAAVYRSTGHHCPAFERSSRVKD